MRPGVVGSRQDPGACTHGVIYHLATPGGGVHGPSCLPRASLDSRGRTIQIPGEGWACVWASGPLLVLNLVIYTGSVSPARRHPHQPCSPDPSACEKGQRAASAGSFQVLSYPLGMTTRAKEIRKVALRGQMVLEYWDHPCTHCLGCLWPTLKACSFFFFLSLSFPWEWCGSFVYTNHQETYFLEGGLWTSQHPLCP